MLAETNFNNRGVKFSSTKKGIDINLEKAGDLLFKIFCKVNIIDMLSYDLQGYRYIIVYNMVYSS